MSKVINLLAGPGCGKSVMAAQLFAELKKRGHDAELVSEYARELVYDGGSDVMMSDQLGILGVQNKRLWRLKKANVDFIVTDSPLLLGLRYATPDYFPKMFERFVLEVFNSYENVNIYLERQPRPHIMDGGRIHNEEESKRIDREIKESLQRYNLDFLSVPANDDAIEAILRYAGAIK